MSIFGITAVRLDRDGWVEAALIGEISGSGKDVVLGTVNERATADIAAMIKRGDEVYCVFGQVNEHGPKFAVAELKQGRERIKLVDDLPERGLQQLIQLEKPVTEHNNPLGSW